MYVQGRRLPGHFSHTAALAEVRKRGTGFVWVGLHEPDEGQMTDIAETFGLHALAVEDVMEGSHRP